MLQENPWNPRKTEAGFFPPKQISSDRGAVGPTSVLRVGPPGAYRPARAVRGPYFKPNPRMSRAQSATANSAPTPISA